MGDNSYNSLLIFQSIWIISFLAVTLTFPLHFALKMMKESHVWKKCTGTVKTNFRTFNNDQQYPWFGKIGQKLV